jgi:molybdopterin molybdotransferase
MRESTSHEPPTAEVSPPPLAAALPDRVTVTLGEARDIILGSARTLGDETVGLADATGRVLAEEIRAGRTVPPLDNSAMDGYAVRAADTQKLPAVLRVVDAIPAGHRSTRRLAAGEAMRIFTGAPIPAGADAVVMQEHTEASGREVAVLRSAGAGDHIRRAGSDVTPETLIAGRGQLLGPAHVGMLAAIGRTQLRVIRQPRVAVISTGDELVEPDRLRDDGRIATSNSYALIACLREIGALPVYLGIVPDQPDTILRAFREGLRCDAVISTGGVSVGEHDWIKQVLAQLGGRLMLWRVAMKPGAPLAFLHTSHVPVFGLPGNPVSTLVSFEQFVRPALLRMMGHAEVFRPVEPALLAETYEKPAGRLHLVRVLLQDREGERFAFIAGDQSSGVLLSMVRAGGLAVIPEDATRVPAGTQVPVLLLHRSDLRASPGF